MNSLKPGRITGRSGYYFYCYVYPVAAADLAAVDVTRKNTTKTVPRHGIVTVRTGEMAPGLRKDGHSMLADCLEAWLANQIVENATA